MEPDDLSVNRRTVLRATGATIGGAALAGCSGGGATDETESPAEETDDSGGGGSDGGSSEDVEEWMSDVGNFDGVTDATGESELSVTVGAEGNGGAYAFDPPAVRVSTGTTVVWEWTGEGSSHNVVAEDGSFESELSAEEGFTFEHTFEEAGTYKYACTPHRSMGMKGVVVVE